MHPAEQHLWLTRRDFFARAGTMPTELELAHELGTTVDDLRTSIEDIDRSEVLRQHRFGKLRCCETVVDHQDFLRHTGCLCAESGFGNVERAESGGRGLRRRE